MNSQASRECWYRYIRLSEEEKRDFRERLNLVVIDISSSEEVDDKIH
tara:strand:+ start:742 stop:882 length:141 start_codon:yes stop_codon:yes gene_type:complete